MHALRVKLTFLLSKCINCRVPLDPIYKHIGAIIRAKRKAFLGKQENLATLLGISRGSLANIETGKQSILVHQLYKFADALQLKPFDLLPPPTVNHSKNEQADLPLPGGLKAEQKKQLANLILQVDTNQTRDKKRSHAKIDKR